ncbi:hypothetical protein MKJ01_13900 [Chryseobacterium sp. SSA4.19]|uniref:hypothetical protein n=1 Tax=Chryseobacterium sp. SSA4.19 TaxID=2919915 RepID=UPI001F4E5712|nr:hypothetical protein [Chryseobacterium sp. SSA4.19]MCJ8154861.1 hypothetical protein [Chryseobacterium sp. SSA4.19]
MKNLNVIHGKKLDKKQLRSINGGAIADCFAQGCPPFVPECPQQPANEFGCTIISIDCAQKECRPR